MGALGRIAARPSVWIAIAVLAMALSSAPTPGAGPEVTYSDFAVVIAVAVAAVQLLRRPDTEVVRSVPALAFGLLGLVSLVVALLSQDFPGSLVGGLRFLQLFCLVPLAVMIALRTRTDAWIMLGALIGLAVAEGIVGVVQTLTGTGAEIGGQPIRAVGTYGAYNIASLGELSGLAIVVCVALGVVATGRARWAAVSVACFLLLPLAFSLSRGAWVATAVAVLITISRGRLSRFLLIATVVALVGGAVLPSLDPDGNDLSARVASVADAGSTPDQSVIDRLALWQAASQMSLDHPLLGVGPRAFSEHRDAYADLSLLGSSDISQGGDFQRVALESPHNFFLLVASEQGLVATAAYALAFLVLLVRGLVRAARHRADASTALTLAGAGVLVYQLVGMISADLGGPGSIQLAIALGVAGWGAADVDLPPEERVRSGSADGAPDAAGHAAPGGGADEVEPPALAGAGARS